MPIGITLRSNAARHDLTTDDGSVLDLSRMSDGQRTKLRRLIRAIHKEHFHDEN